MVYVEVLEGGWEEKLNFEKGGSGMRGDVSPSCRYNIGSYNVSHFLFVKHNFIHFKGLELKETSSKVTDLGKLLCMP